MGAKACEDKFLDYVEGRLPEEEARGFEEDLRTDGELRRSFEAYRAVMDVERELHEVHGTLPAGFDVKVMEAIERSRAGSLRNIVRGWGGQRGMVLAAGASLAMLVLVLKVGLEAPQRKMAGELAPPAADVSPPAPPEPQSPPASEAPAAASAEKERLADYAYNRPRQLNQPQHDALASKSKPQIGRRDAEGLGSALERDIGESKDAADDRTERHKAFAAGAARAPLQSEDAASSPRQASSVSIRLGAREWDRRFKVGGYVSVLLEAEAGVRVLAAEAEIVGLDAGKREVQLRMPPEEAKRVEALRKRGKISLVHQR